MSTFNQEQIVPGAVLNCLMCHGQIIKGEVVEYEKRKKLLIIKSMAEAKKQQVQIVNLEFLKELTVVKKSDERSGSQFDDRMACISFNHSKIKRRKEEEIDKKRRLIPSIKISSCGQAVFLAIKKTIDEVRWSDEMIVVFEKVAITPPYYVDNVHVIARKPSASNQQSVSSPSMAADDAAIYVKKIVDKAVKNFLAKLNASQATMYDKNNNELSSGGENSKFRDGNGKQQSDKIENPISSEKSSCLKHDFDRSRDKKLSEERTNCGKNSTAVV